MNTSTPERETPQFDVVEILNDHLKNSIQRYPVANNNASQLGHPCLRYLVYRRTEWESAQLPPLHAKKKMNEGNTHEDAMIKLMLEAGIEVIQSQKYFRIDPEQITGMIDGKINEKWTKKKIPFEFKSMDTYLYQGINKLEDFKSFTWTEKYLHQLNIYMYNENAERGMFILKDRNTGDFKQINMELDYDMADADLKKAREVNKHIKAKTLPERISVACGECKFCNFKEICLENVDFNQNTSLLSDPVLEQKINERESLIDAKKQYDKLDREIKSLFKETEQSVIVGDFNIVVSHSERKGYTVEPSTTKKVSIERLTL